MSRHPVWNHLDIEEYSAIDAEQLIALYDALSQLPSECKLIKNALELKERDDEHFYYDIQAIVEAIAETP